MMSKKNYEISVLITFYNQEKYVDQAIESVLNQSINVPYKIIVGDDGSTDHTIEKVEAWIEKYPNQIELFIQPRDVDKKYIAGCRASRNRLALLKHVETPYFIYLDGDDYWTDVDKLAVQYSIMEDKNNVDCITCAHQIEMYNESSPNSVEKIPRFSLREKKFSLDEYWEKYYFHTDTMLFRSSVINMLPWEIIEDSFNDNLITFCFLQFGKVYYLPKCMAAYRQNSNGIWAGEKLATNIFRNIISYDLEMQINSNLQSAIWVRHIVDFITVAKNRELFSEIATPYYELAEKYRCKTALHLVRDGYTLKKKRIMENIFILYLVIYSKFTNLKILWDINLGRRA